MVRVAGHEDRDDDGADGLVSGEPDGATDGLHDVDLGAFRVDEDHAVQRGHVDTLGQAARVGQQPAMVGVDGAEFPQPYTALVGGHRTRDVVRPHLAGGPLVVGHPGDDLGQRAGEPAGTVDPRVEADGAAQVVAAHRLGQRRSVRPAVRASVSLMPSDSTQRALSAISRHSTSSTPITTT